MLKHIKYNIYKGESQPYGMYYFIWISLSANVQHRSTCSFNLKKPSYSPFAFIIAFMLCSGFIEYGHFLIIIQTNLTNIAAFNCNI